MFLVLFSLLDVNLQFLISIDTALNYHIDSLRVGMGIVLFLRAGATWGSEERPGSCCAAVDLDTQLIRCSEHF